MASHRRRLLAAAAGAAWPLTAAAQTSDPWAELPAILARIEAPRFPNGDFALSSFGGSGDGRTMNTEAFMTFRGLMAAYEAERPERLTSSHFARREPEELLYDEIEAIWAAIDQGDDWSTFEAKVRAIREAGSALA